MRIWRTMAITFLLSGCGQSPDQPKETVAAAPPIVAANASSETDPPDFTPTETSKPPAEQSGLTAAQANALRSAQQYLRMTGLSRRGLIDQLSSEAGEGYSVADATAAVDSLDVDWNENAARSAEQYLKMTGFSCKGLIEQLSSDAGEKYTLAQATYGARAAGAC
jgi:hypothetical protein